MVISKEKLASLPVEVFKGKIQVIDKPELVDAACEILEQAELIGFDTETKPTFKKGVSHRVSLLQLSTEDTCFLFRLNLIGMPSRVMDILNSPQIRIIGLSLKDDFSALHKIGVSNLNNFIDIQSMVKAYDIEDISLQKVYGIIFGKRITKGQRLTNWEAEELTEAQQMYAAIDAWACLRIYKELITHKPIG